MHFEDAQALHLEVTGLSNVLGDATHGPDIAYVPTIELGGVVSILWLPVIFEVLHELRRNVLDVHPRELFADWHSINA